MGLLDLNHIASNVHHQFLQGIICNALHHLRVSMTCKKCMLGNTLQATGCLFARDTLCLATLLHVLLLACRQAAGKIAKAARILAMRPGQSKKPSGTSALRVVADEVPSGNPTPPSAGIHQAGEHQTHPAGLAD